MGGASAASLNVGTPPVLLLPSKQAFPRRLASAGGCGGERSGRRAARPCRPRDSGRAGLSVAVAAIALPRLCGAALSISSGYEAFLSQIRRNIVCDESDVFNEAMELARAPPCDSMRDGPFCRGLPAAQVAQVRHRPSTVDSIIPQQFFGNVGEEEESAAVGKQATETLNKFLQEHYNAKEAAVRAIAMEGSLDFRHVPPQSKMSPTFSRGLPAGVIVTWDGAWQTDIVAGAAASDTGAASAWPGQGPMIAAARLNGALGVLRFSRPVVIRTLRVRPPVGAVDGRPRLVVRARKAGKEVWRSAYEFDPAVGPVAPPLCSPGDIVIARWAGDGRKDLATVLSWHARTATLRWADDDNSHRTVPWKHITTPDGVRCGGPTDPLGVRDFGAMGKGFGGSTPRRPPPSIWRDLARRIKSVDELSFSVPQGPEGWLLGELGVAALQPVSPDAEPEGKVHVVQVLPGPRAIITEASKAAVMYHADEMLEQGLKLRSNKARQGDADVQRLDAESLYDGDDPTQQLRLHSGRSAEGFAQLLDAFGQKAFPLPPHVRRKDVLADIERLLLLLTKTIHDKRHLKQFGHFESLFAYLWDYITPIDALQVSYDRWRRHEAATQETNGVFHVGQHWFGSYFCTQGQTTLVLNITKADGPLVEADLTFTIGARGTKHDAPVQGKYTVAGRIASKARALSLEPVTWKQQPPNFVMVGLQGVVTRVPNRNTRLVRYAGSVPIVGCDSFELTSLAATPTALEKEKEEAQTENSFGPQQIVVLPLFAKADEEWRGPVLRLLRGFEEVRAKWRVALHKMLEAERRNSTSAGGAAAGGTVVQVAQLLSAHLAQQLLEAARTGGLTSLVDAEGGTLKVEMVDNGDGDVVFQLG